MSRIILIVFLFIVSCNKKDEVAIARITDVLKDDLQNMVVTDTMELLEKGTNQNTNIVTNIVPSVIEPPQYEQPVVYESLDTLLPVIVTGRDELPPQNTTIPKREEYTARPSAIPKETLHVVQQDAFIKIGEDTPGLTVSRNRSQKITAVIFSRMRATSVDVYLYAVPRKSRMVRNYNTLIGFAKDIEFVQGQAQFTKHWRANRSDGRSLNKGHHNVYVEYHYKNSRGQVVQKEGRYWGGNHRRWTVRVL